MPKAHSEDPSCITLAEPLETIRNAADQLKKLYGGKGKMRLKLFISVKGIKLFDYFTMVHKPIAVGTCSMSYTLRK